MNAPFNGKFRLTQQQHANHDGFDLVPLEDKNIYSTVAGVVVWAGWENKDNVKQGFGQYVCIKNDADGAFYYFGHMSEVSVKYNDKVKVCDKIGVVGHTGYCIPDNENGTHLHYCARKQFSTGNALDISAISGIPNALGVYDDGYRPNANTAKPQQAQTSPTAALDNDIKVSIKPKTTKEIEAIIEAYGHTYSGLLTED